MTYLIWDSAKARVDSTNLIAAAVSSAVTMKVPSSYRRTDAKSVPWSFDSSVDENAFLVNDLCQSTN